MYPQYCIKHIYTKTYPFFIWNLSIIGHLYLFAKSNKPCPGPQRVLSVSSINLVSSHVSLDSGLVPLGCCNRVPWPGWLLNNIHFFLTVMEAGKSKIKTLADFVSDKYPLPGSEAAVFSLYPPDLFTPRRPHLLIPSPRGSVSGYKFCVGIQTLWLWPVPSEANPEKGHRYRWLD